MMRIVIGVWWVAVVHGLVACGVEAPPAAVSGSGGVSVGFDDTESGGANSDGSGGSDRSDGTAGDATMADETGSDPGTSTTAGTNAETADASDDPDGPRTTGLDVEPCQVGQIPLTPIPPNVMLVLDKSGSMSIEQWDHDQNPATPTVTRWWTLHTVVDALLSQWESDVKFGVKLFPKFSACATCTALCQENATCQACYVDPGVEQACALDNKAGVLGSIPNAGDTVYGGTPMQTGLTDAWSYIAGITDEPRALLLVADGAISCAGQSFAAAKDVVTGAWAAGVPTYVVGIDANALTAAQLDELAFEGGKPNPNGPPWFYQTFNQADLDAAMAGIIADTLSCDVLIGVAPNWPDLFEVWVDGQEVPEVVDCDTEHGWVWTVEHTEIRLCNDACDALKTAGALEAKYYCVPG